MCVLSSVFSDSGGVSLNIPRIMNSLIKWRGQQLHNLIAGRSAITPEMAVKLELAIGGTADAWLRMQMNYDLAHVRKRGVNVTRLVPA